MIWDYIILIVLGCAFIIVVFLFSIAPWDVTETEVETEIEVEVEAGDEFIIISDNPFIGEDGRIKIIEVKRGNDGKKWIAYCDYSYEHNRYLGSVYYCTLLHLIETGYIKVKK